MGDTTSRFRVYWTEPELQRRGRTGKLHESVFAPTGKTPSRSGRPKTQELHPGLYRKLKVKENKMAGSEFGSVALE